MAQLKDATERVWRQEPDDIRRLRSLTRPPMGNLPCVLYANFNTFWAGENLQVYRQLAREGTVPLGALNQAAARVLERHAARLAKWDLHDTVDLVTAVADYFRAGGPRSKAEFMEVCEAFLLCLDRVNSWIDAIIPWSDLDRAVAVRPSWHDPLVQPALTGGDANVRNCRPVG
ncbi:MAG: hypothetical protein K6T30_05480 [Alicyclobacillus sp.]|nr:hypothetical protein [Alicyclobacillus sp.]